MSRYIFDTENGTITTEKGVEVTSGTLFATAEEICDVLKGIEPTGALKLISDQALAAAIKLGESDLGIVEQVYTFGDFHKMADHGYNYYYKFKSESAAGASIMHCINAYSPLEKQDTQFITDGVSYIAHRVYNETDDSWSEWASKSFPASEKAHEMVTNLANLINAAIVKPKYYSIPFFSQKDNLKFDITGTIGVTWTDGASSDGVFVSNGIMKTLGIMYKADGSFDKPAEEASQGFSSCFSLDQDEKGRIILTATGAGLYAIATFINESFKFDEY